MGKTNSNSITAILVNKLNYKKSGFRAAILKLWELQDDTIFYSGMYSSIDIRGINDKKPDILGYRKGKPCVLIEVKANLKEKLLPSQRKKGDYENAVYENKELKLVYLIPDGYEHSDKLPRNSHKIHTFLWSEIYEVAKEYDNTGFTEQINNFVENRLQKNDLLLSKGDVAMFLSPSIINQVNDLYNGKKILVKDFFNSNSNRPRLKNDGFGWYHKFGEKTHFWIGLCKVNKFECSFFICIWIEEGKIEDYKYSGYKEMESYFLDQKEAGVDIYIPIEKSNIAFIEKYFDKHLNELNLSHFDKLISNTENTDLTPSDIVRVESLYSKINGLMEKFEKSDSSPIKKQSESKCHKDLGWWYDFKDSEKPKAVWIGICKVGKSESSFFMCVWINKDIISTYKNLGEKDKDYFWDNKKKDIYVPIKDPNNKILPAFIFSEDADDQQKKFNELMSHNIKKLLNMLGKN